MKVAIGTPIFLIMVSALFYGALSQPPPPPPSPPLPGWRIDHTVTLQGDTGEYLCRWGPHDIKIYKDSPDRFCHFEMIENDDGTRSFRADNGLFVSLIGPYDIEATKNCIDRYTRFTTEVLPGAEHGVSKIALKADTGKYLTRWGPTGLQARKSTRDKYCEFTMQQHFSLDYMYC
jgi:hypothetical protein